MYSRAIETIKKEFKDNLLSIILFGSVARGFRGKDVDLLVVVKKLPKGISEIRTSEKKIESALLKRTGLSFDVHLFTLDGIKKNLVPGTFLMGVALGYKVLFDVGGVEEVVKEFLRSLWGKNIIYLDKYGKWNIGKIAKIMVR